jgi:hypothetical protein
MSENILNCHKAISPIIKQLLEEYPVADVACALVEESALLVGIAVTSPEGIPEIFAGAAELALSIHLQKGQVPHDAQA